MWYYKADVHLIIEIAHVRKVQFILKRKLSLLVI